MLSNVKVIQVSIRSNWGACMGRPSNFEKRFYARMRLLAEQSWRAEEVEFDEKPERRLCPATAHLHPDYQSSCSECVGALCKKMVALGLDDQRQPLPYLQRPYCGAITRNQFSCQQRVVPGKARCRFHGGHSTGPKTEEGRKRISEAQKLRWKRFRASKLTS